MNFSDIAKRFEQSGAGTDSFKDLYRGLEETMREDPQNAALYFPVAVAARAYVLKFEDQPVENDFAERVKIRFLGFHRKILDVLAHPAAARFSVASEIAADYELHIREF